MGFPIHSALLGQLGRFFPSYCTILANTATTKNEYNETSKDFLAVPGLISIPCTNAAAIQAVPAEQEFRGQKFTSDVADKHVLLKGYYDGINIADRAMVDGVTYNIISVEPDSHKKTTRLRVQEIKL